MDFEKYRHHLEKFDMTRKHEDEVMSIVWGMMESSVDQAFGVHPLQQALGKKEESSLQSHNQPLDSKLPNTSGSFNSSTQSSEETRH